MDDFTKQFNKEYIGCNSDTDGDEVYSIYYDK